MASKQTRHGGGQSRNGAVGADAAAVELDGFVPSTSGPNITLYAANHPSPTSCSKLANVGMEIMAIMPGNAYTTAPHMALSGTMVFAIVTARKSEGNTASNRGVADAYKSSMIRTRYDKLIATSICGGTRLEASSSPKPSTMRSRSLAASRAERSKSRKSFSFS